MLNKNKVQKLIDNHVEDILTFTKNLSENENKTFQAIHDYIREHIKKDMRNRVLEQLTTRQRRYYYPKETDLIKNAFCHFYTEAFKKLIPHQEPNTKAREKIIKKLSVAIGKKIPEQLQINVYDSLMNDEQEDWRRNIISYAYCKFHTKNIQELMRSRSSTKEVSDYLKQRVPEHIRKDVIDNASIDDNFNVFSELFVKKIQDLVKKKPSEDEAKLVEDDVRKIISDEIPKKIRSKIYMSILKLKWEHNWQNKCLSNIFCEFFAKNIQSIIFSHLNNLSKGEYKRDAIYIVESLMENVPSDKKGLVFNKLLNLEWRQGWQKKPISILFYLHKLHELMPKKEPDDRLEFIDKLKSFFESIDSNELLFEVYSRAGVKWRKTGYIEHAWQNYCLTTAYTKAQETLTKKAAQNSQNEEKQEKEPEPLPSSAAQNTNPSGLESQERKEISEEKNSETIKIEDLSSYQNLQKHIGSTYNNNKDELLRHFLAKVKTTFDANNNAESARSILDLNYKLDKNNELIVIPIDDDSQGSEVTLRSHTRCFSKILIRFGCYSEPRSKTAELIDDLAQEMDREFKLVNSQ